MEWYDNLLRLELAEFSSSQNQELIRALKQVDCKRLWIGLDQYDGVTNLDFFLECLQYAPEQVILRDGKRSSVQVVGRFLQALAKNTNLKQLGLCDLMFSATTLETFLRSSTSNQKLSIMGCSVAEMTSPHQQWKENLKTALFNNQTLRCLKLCYTDVIYMAHILEDLGQHPTIDQLELSAAARNHFHATISMETSKAVRALLENQNFVKPIRVRFLLARFQDDSFHPIAEGVFHCPDAVTLAFHTCTFDAVATAHFESMFQAHSTLRSIEIGHVTLAKPTQDVIKESVLGPFSPLESLSLASTHSKGPLVAATMVALKTNTTLQSLTIETIHGEVLDSIVEGLPRVQQLKVLKCHRLNFPSTDATRRLSQAFQQNVSILDFVCLDGQLSKYQTEQLERIFKRNESLQQHLLNNPDVVPTSAWPSVLALTKKMEYGNDIVYRGLRCLVDSIEQKSSPLEAAI
jgi:hypothetical protein